MTKKPYIIGIAGPSCSGKTTLANYLAGLLTAKAPVVISLDSYYRDLPTLDMAERIRCNFDSPDALDSELLLDQLKKLTQGEEIDKPIYQFSTHTRASHSERVKPGELVIIEGLFVFYWEEIRELLDLKVFVIADDAVCLSRRQTRDVKERGRSPESVIIQYLQTVHPMAKQYVLPTRQFADVVVSGEDLVESSVAAILTGMRKRFR
jgi:uridine kinase